ncbi:MAG: hypothetical protein MZV65_35370 [Chromatiales bacterium]|nr:hypothetical protein [Chromatiales bacterium]
MGWFRQRGSITSIRTEGRVPAAVFCHGPAVRLFGRQLRLLLHPRSAQAVSALVTHLPEFFNHAPFRSIRAFAIACRMSSTTARTAMRRKVIHHLIGNLARIRQPNSLS